MMAYMLKDSVEQDKIDFKPKKFLMWLFVITSFMLFAALTSGFIVYTAGDPSRGIKMILPKLLMYSTGVIAVSSVTMHSAYRAAKQLKFGMQKLYLSLTVALGLAFLVMQVLVCKGFVENGIYFINPNASQSFIYVFIFTHLLHIVAGLFVLLNAFSGLSKNIPQVKNLFKMEMASIFWHFLDILWIYLYVFLLLNQ